MSAIRCRCCGIPVTGPRAQFRVCIGCDLCDELHGDKLQGILAMAVRDGKIAPYTALARLLIDDAQLTGRAVYIEREAGGVADLRIPKPPLPWLIVCGRSLARGQTPDVKSVVDAVLVRYIPGSSAPHRMAELCLELRDALQFVDPDIMDVEVTTTRDVIDPGNLRIEIKARTPTLGSVVANATDVDIPADILSRPRAEA